MATQASVEWVEWDSGILDCFEDPKTCCYGFWCCPCLASTVSTKFGENACLPLCDLCSPGIFAVCGIPLFAPPAVVSLRAALRNRFHIKGSVCRDILTGCCCMWCTWCQMHRELRFRNKTPTIINVQSSTIVQQPAPMFMTPAQPAPVFMTPAQPAPIMMASY